MPTAGQNNGHIRPSPIHMLWHYAQGEFPNYTAGEGTSVGWVRYEHRGIQRLDRIDIPRKQRRYVFAGQFEIRCNQAFEEVLHHCAHRTDDKHTWITPQLAEGYLRLHKAGYAHSFEAWQAGKLVGGCFGVQLGGLITVESMFHHLSNAAKAAYGQTLLRLRQRGFRIVDTNGVSEHLVNYGEEWIKQWQFEVMLRDLLRQTPSISDDHPCQPLPWQLKIGLPLARLSNAVARRLRRGAALLLNV